MRPLLILSFVCFWGESTAQHIDTLQRNKVVVFRDYRLDILQQKEIEINTALYKSQAHTTQGYRLMVLNTNDKEYAYKIRAELLQKFPEQKPYMWFANPYIRIKFGDFRTKEEADVYKSQISKMLGGANIYYIPETIEITPDRDSDPGLLK